MANEQVRAFYNESMPAKFGDDYEFSRWFGNPILQAGYELTKEAIKRHVIADDLLQPKRILELGPGAGTWTKMLLKRFPHAAVELLDISKEMLARSRKVLPKDRHVHYIEADILEWEPKEQYDLFFSSRVLEYIDDKEKFAHKVSALLASKGSGFLITKMPHYERERFLGRTTSELHRGQIAPVALVDTLREAGFIDVSLFPVTVSVPLFHSPKLNLALGRFLGPHALGLIGMIFAESYCVCFRKP